MCIHHRPLAESVHGNTQADEYCTDEYDHQNLSRNSGYGALEGIVKVICEKTSIPLKNAKILQDAVLVIGGILLHATWGVGTIIGIVLTGPFMQMSNKLFSKQY